MTSSSSIQGFFVTGGTLWSNAPSYVIRPADEELLRLTSAGEYCNVLAARQMGKSSLMVRTSLRLREASVQTAIIDISTLGGGISSPDEWFFGFLDELSVQFDLDVDFPAWWERHIGQNAVQRFSNFVRDVLLTEIQSPIVVFIDEIDSALGMAFTDDFFAAIRGAYNARATHPAFQRLAFVLVGVARPADLIRDRSRTPYNIGHHIQLSDFTLPELRSFESVLETAYPGQGTDIVRWILAWTNGQPYLTQKLCAALITQSPHQASSHSPIPQALNQETVAATVHRLFFTDEARKESNLQAIRDRIESSPRKLEMLQIYDQVLRGKSVPDEERSLAKNDLKLTGLVRPTSSGQLEVRNRIYRQVFDRAWVRKNLPQSRSRQVAIFTSFVAVLAILIAGHAFYQQRQQSTLLFKQQFESSNSPDVKLTNLSRLLEGSDAAVAHELYDSLTHTEQVSLFTDLSDSQNVARELVIVIRAVYQENENTPEGNELLNAMETVLGEIGAIGAPSLKTEIDFWLLGRAEYEQQNYETAVSLYNNAWRESESRQQPNLTIRFDRALALIANGQYALALDDLQAVWDQNPTARDTIAQTINTHPALANLTLNSEQAPEMLALITPVQSSPTPSPTPTPTATPTSSLTPTITSTPSATPSPTPEPLSPYTNWIAFAFGENTAREIYIMSPTGETQIRVTNNGMIEEGPAWSPDNWQLIYGSQRSQNGWELYIYDLKTNTERQLTSFDGQARFPAWSPIPGDQRIVFEGRAPQTNASNLWLVQADTGVLTQLTTYGTDFRPTWSPDGTQILFGRATADTSGNGFTDASDNGDLYILDLASREEYQITHSVEFDEFNFSWSPDGNWIVFTSVRGDVDGDGVQNLNDSQDLYRVRPDGTDERLLNLDGKRTFSPSWSPDSRFIVLLVLGEENQNEIWRFDTKNNNFIALTEPGPYYQPVYSNPNLMAFTPLNFNDFDLAFVSDRDGEYGVYVMDTQSISQWHPLPRPSGFERTWWPTFCNVPNSPSIAYEAVDVDGLQPQWIYSAFSGNIVPVKYPTTLEAARFGVPRCSPSGEQMAFSTYVPSIFEGWILGLKDYQTGEEFVMADNPSFGNVSWSNVANFFLSMTIIEEEFYVLETTNLQSNPMLRTLAKGKYPALSPNGNQFVYLCANQTYLCLQEVAGQNSELIQEVYSISLAGQSVPVTAMWSGDGLWIYFASATDGDWDIYRVRPDGSELQNLTADWPSNELMPALRWE